jgi:hypothetical protein
MSAKVLLAAGLLGAVASQNISCNSAAQSLYDGSFSSNYINGTAFNLNVYKGNVLLITNVASF